MKFLKTLLWIILALLVCFLLVAAISKKDFKASQSTVIEAPQSLVFNTVNDLSTWDSWSPWVEMDKTNVTTMGDKFIGEGGSYSWSGQETGSGELKIVKVETPKSIETQMTFDGQGEANAAFDFEPADGGGTKATWSFHTHVGFPWNAFMVFNGMEKTIDKQYKRGLELLKTKIETIAARKPKINVKEVDYPGQTFLVHREKVKMDDITGQYEKYLPELFGQAQKNKLEIAGMPGGLFFSWDPDNGTTDLGCAVPIAFGSKAPKGMSTFSTKPGKALHVDYYGSYEGTVAAHDAIEAHMKAKGHEMVWPCIETSVTDPTTEPDPNKWLTQVVYPLQ